MRFFLLLSFLLVGITFSNAQWSHINSSWNPDDFYFVTINEGAGVSLAGGSQIIKSTNGGSTWSVINTSSNTYNTGLILSASTYLVAGENSFGNGGIWRSTNSGSTWTSVSSSGAIINDIASNGTVVVAVGNSGLIRTSSDGGATWTTVTSGVSTKLNTVEWDPLQNKWIIGGEQHRLVSLAVNASSWTNQSNSYKITEINFRNNRLTETRVYPATTDSSAIILYDNAGMINNMTRCGYQKVLKSVYTPDNRILGSGYKKFFEVDLSLNELSIGVDSIYNQAIYSGTARNIAAIDICATYALAVGYNGSLARYDLSNPLGTYAPADFYIPDTVSTCPGAAFVAIPICSQADTYAWYMDNVLVSTEDTLYGNWPNNNATFPLRLITTTNGFQSTYTRYVQVNNYITFPTYTLTVDTSICYGGDLSVYLNLQSGSLSGFSFQFVSNNYVIGTGPMPASQAHFVYPNMTQSGTIDMQLFKTGVCGTSYQSNAYAIHVGPNLMDTYTLVSADTGICSFGDSIHFAISNLVQGATYILTNHEFYDGNYIGPFPFDTIVGMGADTISLSYPGDLFYYSQLTAENVYADIDVSNYINAYATYDGCSTVTSSFLSFDITNPNANFSIVDQPTIIDDTLNLVNLQITDTSTWSISPVNGIASGLNNPVPLFAPSQPAEYLVKLLNTTRFGCTDSIVRKHVAGSLLNNDILSTTCFATKLASMSVLGSVVDNSNNLIEYGYYTNSVPAWTGFAIRKLDSLGTLLWEKSLDYGVDFWGGTHLLTAIDIDADDNIYAAVRLKDDGYASFPLNFESIHLNDGYNTGYILKWSPGGQLLANFPTTLLEVSDIEVTKNQVHVAGIGAVLTLNTDLVLLHNYQLNGYGYQDNIYGYGSNPESLNEWKWKPRYPKLTSLPNGKIIFVSDIFVPTSSVTVSPGVTITPNSINAQVVFGAEYTPDQGLSNPKKIFEIPFNPGNQDRMGIVAGLLSDEDHYIYILTDPKSNKNMTFFDSVVTVDSDQINKSFLVKLDADLNPEWIIHSNLSKGSLNYAIGKGQLYLTGTLKNRVYIGSGNDFRVINGRNAGSNVNDETFYAVINKQGNMIAGGAFGQTGIQNGYKMVCSVSKCGELFISQDSKADDSWSTPPYTYGSSYLHVEINETDYAVDSNYVFKLSEASCFASCPYLVLFAPQDITACYSDSIIAIPVYETQDMDSTSYEIIENNVVVASGNAAVINQSIQVPNTLTNNQQLVVHGTTGSILTDTIQVQFLNAMNPMLPVYHVACFDSLSVQLNPADYPSVYWFSNLTGGSSDHMIVYTPSDFVIGDTVTKSITYTDLHGCSSEDFFDIVYCDDLSVNSLSTASISLSPNPAENTIVLRLEEGAMGLCAVRIFNTEGREVFSERIPFGQEIQLNVAFLTNGFYLLKLKSGQDSSEYSFRFVKQ